MALPRSWEELNDEVGYGISEPIDEYFEPMRISDRRKENRKDLAYDLEDAVSGLLVDAFYAEQYGTTLSFDELNQLSQAKVRSTSRTDPVVRAREEYIDAVEDYFPVDEEIMGHIDETLIGAMLILLRHRDEPYYYSADRARAIAENDSNNLWNCQELKEAHDRGFRFKTWNTIMDGRERDSHAEINGKTIRLEELFQLRGGYMAYPKDLTYDPDPDEYNNCRCSLSFS